MGIISWACISRITINEFMDFNEDAKNNTTFCTLAVSPHHHRVYTSQSESIVLFCFSLAKTSCDIKE
jgi:hypothetical protein